MSQEESFNRFDVGYLSSGFKGFPIGTVACYGPDDKTVLKIVASVVADEAGNISEIKKWAGSDVHGNPEVQKEIAEFFKAQGVKSTAITTTPIGCIHEKGADFPAGEDCPFCPFWKDKQ